MAPVAAFEEDETDEWRWTMPLVVRIERAEPPAHTDVLEAVAKACLGVVDDERAMGEWAAAFGAWTGRSRKVVRRARGAHWSAVGDVPGVTVVSGSAEVRAFPPTPAADLPKELSRLQVGGTDLTDPETPLPPPPTGGPTLWLNPSLSMTTGKAAAQAGHAALRVFESLAPAERSAWRLAGYPLAVRRADAIRWTALSGVAIEIADGGLTEIEAGSITVRAELPPATMG
ncbi:MAG: peptidyl-tRNA hydrolase [Actinomycetota bacterium]|nr:peptidyl-tRNA hydrolase [Actinomycetota bacterium]